MVIDEARVNIRGYAPIEGDDRLAAAGVWSAINPGQPLPSGMPASHASRQVQVTRLQRQVEEQVFYAAPIIATDQGRPELASTWGEGANRRAQANRYEAISGLYSRPTLNADGVPDGGREAVPFAQLSPEQQEQIRAARTAILTAEFRQELLARGVVAQAGGSLVVAGANNSQVRVLGQAFSPSELRLALAYAVGGTPTVTQEQFAAAEQQRPGYAAFVQELQAAARATASDEVRQELAAPATTAERRAQLLQQETRRLLDTQLPDVGGAARAELDRRATEFVSQILPRTEVAGGLNRVVLPASARFEEEGLTTGPRDQRVPTNAPDFQRIATERMGIRTGFLRHEGQQEAAWRDTLTEQQRSRLAEISTIADGQQRSEALQQFVLATTLSRAINESRGAIEGGVAAPASYSVAERGMVSRLSVAAGAVQADSTAVLTLAQLYAGTAVNFGAVGEQGAAAQPTVGFTPAGRNDPFAGALERVTRHMGALDAAGRADFRRDMERVQVAIDNSIEQVAREGGPYSVDLTRVSASTRELLAGMRGVRMDGDRLVPATAAGDQRLPAETLLRLANFAAGSRVITLAGIAQGSVPTAQQRPAPAPAPAAPPRPPAAQRGAAAPAPAQPRAAAPPPPAVLATATVPPAAQVNGEQRLEITPPAEVWARGLGSMVDARTISGEGNPFHHTRAVQVVGISANGQQVWLVGQDSTAPNRETQVSLADLRQFPQNAAALQALEAERARQVAALQAATRPLDNVEIMRRLQELEAQGARQNPPVTGSVIAAIALNDPANQAHIAAIGERIGATPAQMQAAVRAGAGAAVGAASSLGLPDASDRSAAARAARAAQRNAPGNARSAAGSAQPTADALMEAMNPGALAAARARMEAAEAERARTGQAAAPRSAVPPAEPRAPAQGGGGNVVPPGFQGGAPAPLPGQPPAQRVIPPPASPPAGGPAVGPDGVRNPGSFLRQTSAPIDGRVSLVAGSARMDVRGTMGQGMPTPDSPRQQVLAMRDGTKIVMSFGSPPSEGLRQVAVVADGRPQYLTPQEFAARQAAGAFAGAVPVLSG